MRGELSQLSQTLVVGASVLIGLECIRLLWSLDWGQTWSQLGVELSKKDSITKKVLVVLSISFVLGMLLEGLAHQYEEHGWPAFGVKCGPTTKELRRNVLRNTNHLAQQLAVEGVKNQLAAYNSPLPDNIAQVSSNTANDVFHIAKNRVYRESYAEELIGYEDRTIFASAISLVSYLLSFVVVLAMVARLGSGFRARRGPIGDSKEVANPWPSVYKGVGRLAAFACLCLSLAYFAEKVWQYQEEQYVKRVLGYYSSVMDGSSDAGKPPHPAKP